MFIEPSSLQERKYCKKYNISIKRLKNGMTIIAIPQIVPDLAWVRINWRFPYGSWKHKPGIVHFLEHMINKTAMPIAQENSLYLNAYTSSIEIGEVLEGIANPAVQDYGVWPILEAIRKRLESPVKYLKNPQQTVNSEKEVVKAEIKMRYGEHNWHVSRHFLETLFSTQNPLSENAIGTIDDIDKIDLETIQEIESDIFLSKGTVVSIYSSGSLKVNRVLTNRIEKLFSDFPLRKGKEEYAVKKTDLEKLNPSFKQGKTYLKNTGLNNDIITTEYVWVLKFKAFSKGYFATSMLLEELRSRLHNLSREQGWGYYTEVIFDMQSLNLPILTFRVDTRKEYKPDIVNGIKQILESFNHDDLGKIQNKEEKKQRATPITAHDRLSWIVQPLKTLDKIVDADMVRKATLGLTVKDYQRALTKLKSIEPAILVTGDLG